MPLVKSEDRPSKPRYRKITLEILVPNEPGFISWLVAAAIQDNFTDAKDVRVIGSTPQEEDYL
jgi:hypothetical protein